MEGRPERIADYFVVVGIGSESLSKFEQFSSEDEVTLPTNKSIPEPVTDIAVFYSKHEELPEGYEVIKSTPQGHNANLSIGSLFSNGPIYICYRKGKHKPPITDIGVLHSSQNQTPPVGYEVLTSSVGNKSADLNKSGRSPSYLTFKRDLMQGHSNAITDLCIVAPNKGEEPPDCFKLLRSLDLSKGLVGHTLHLCYRTSQVRPPSAAYTPELLSRYPLSDHPEFPLPHSVPLFCLPFGVSVEHWGSQTTFPYPTFSTFALTNAQGQCMYGAVVVFYEAVGDHKCGKEMRKELNISEEEPLHMNKCICLLSRWPFFPSFKAFLSSLYRLSISHNIPLPLERYIGNLMQEVPFPTMVRPRVQMHIGSESIVFSLPVQTPLPLSVSTHWSLLSSLDPDNCLTLLTLTLLEQKLVLHSSRPALLTCVGEALRSLLFPFSWQCTYIPLCPLAFSSYMQAPVPFIIGIDSQYFDVSEKPIGVTVVDLDANSIHMNKEVQELLSKSPLPSKASKTLKQALAHLSPRVNGLDSGLDLAVEVSPIDYKHTYKYDLEVVDVEIREAFLRFFATVIGHYRKYLTPLLSAPSERSRDTSHLFNQKMFLKSCSSNEWPFFNLFFDTQIFNAFIEQRSFAHTENSSLVFFDECAEKVKRHPSSKLLNAEASISRQSDLPTVVSLPPDDSGLPSGKTYSYQSFPSDFNPDFFNPQSSLNRSSSSNSSHIPCPSHPVASGSPLVAHRTPAEKSKDKEYLEKALKSDSQWSKSLSSHICSLWYVLLPAHLSTHWNKVGVLSQAMELLEDMRINKALPKDEVCYRILMQQCVNLGRPALAVRVYHEMRKAGIQPNAITYGFYNKTVLEGRWPNQKRRWKVLLIIITVCLYLNNLKKKEKSLHGNLFEEADFSLITRSGSMSNRKSISALDVGLDEEEATLDGQASLSMTRKLLHKGATFKLTAGAPSGSGDYIVCGDSSYVAEKSPLWGEGRKTDRGLNRDLWSNVTLAGSQSPSRVRRINRTGTPKESTPSLNVELSTCSQCPTCHCLLYDEQIMSGWNGDEADYKTTCPYCSSQLVASLTIVTKQTLPCSKPSNSVNIDSPTVSSSTPTVPEEKEIFIDSGDKTWPRTRLKAANVISKFNDVPDSEESTDSVFKLPKSENTSTYNEETGNPDVRTDIEIANGTSHRLNSTIHSKTNSIHRQNPESGSNSIHTLDDSGSPSIKPPISDSKLPSFGVGGCFDARSLTLPESELLLSSVFSAKSKRASFNRRSPTPVSDSDHEEGIDMAPRSRSKSNAPNYKVSDSHGEDQTDGGGISSIIANMKAIGHKRASSAPIKKLSHSATFVGQDHNISFQVPTASTTSELPGYTTETRPPMVVPYLSPVVLRKEVESLLSLDGAKLLEKEELVRERPIIYWNLVWYFSRLCLPTYLPLLSLWDFQRQNQELKKQSVCMKVDLLWDSRFLGIREPLYLLWLGKVPRTVQLLTKPEVKRRNSESQLQSLVARVQCGDWPPIITSLLKDRLKGAEPTVEEAESEPVPRSIYRETLFLKMVVSAHTNIDQFDREYLQHIQKLPKELSAKLHPYDYPPTQRSVHCRRDFGLLKVK